MTIASYGKLFLLKLSFNFQIDSSNTSFLILFSQTYKIINSSTFEVIIGFTLSILKAKNPE